MKMKVTPNNMPWCNQYFINSGEVVGNLADTLRHIHTESNAVS